MIYSLRKKFIKISVLSVAAVLLVIYVVIGAINVQQMNERADSFTDIIGENDGRFPQWDKIHEKPDDMERQCNFALHQENMKAFRSLILINSSKS